VIKSNAEWIDWWLIMYSLLINTWLIEWENYNNARRDFLSLREQERIYVQEQDK